MRYRYIYKYRTGLTKVRTKLAIAITAVGLGVGGVIGSVAIFGAAHAAPPTVVYNNIPSPQPGNLPSEAFEAQTVSEFGGQVTFAGTSRNNPTVTVLMSSWGCESGHWFSNDCSTTTGATFNEHVTLNVYAVNSDNSPGSKLLTSTQTFAIPYRPSATPACGDGRWSPDGGVNCFNGFATPVVFNLTGALPDKAIISVAYNTTHYGYAPIGEAAPCFTSSAGCGYDSLNVGVTGPPTTGSNPLPDDAYLFATTVDPNAGYCSAGPTSVFRLDTGCWTGNQPAFEVTASAPQVLGSATGGLTLSSPRQQISFNAFDTGANSTGDYGTVEYQNFDYPGGLHYTANVICATVSGNKATFLFQIPTGSPLAGTYVVASVTDGGSPGKGHDIYGHTTAPDLAAGQAMCESNNASVGTYIVTGGNAVVHKQ